MLINPVFDKRIWLKKIREDMHEKVRFIESDTLFVLEMNLDGLWLTAAGFEKIQDGVFWTDKNPHMYLEDAYGRNLLQSIHEYTDHKRLDWRDVADHLEWFGVADSPEQLLAHPQFIKQFVEPSDEYYVVCCTPIHKEDQPETDGWKWDGAGIYIGEHAPQAEYIRDEPEIDSVIVFHVFMIAEKKTEGNFIIDFIKKE